MPTTLPTKADGVVPPRTQGMRLGCGSRQRETAKASNALRGSSAADVGGRLGLSNTHGAIVHLTDMAAHPESQTRKKFVEPGAQANRSASMMGAESQGAEAGTPANTPTAAVGGTRKYRPWWTQHGGRML